MVSVDATFHRRDRSGHRRTPASATVSSAVRAAAATEDSLHTVMTLGSATVSLTQEETRVVWGWGGQGGVWMSK